MINAATAVRSSEAVLNYCVTHFGNGLEVCVGAYAKGIPGEEDSPFLWIYADDAENEAVNTDEGFTAKMVVGGCVKSENGESIIENVVAERTATANGLKINGGNKVVEDLRDLILGVVRNAAGGAVVSRIRREENDISHYPLEWAVAYVEYTEFTTL